MKPLKADFIQREVLREGAQPAWVDEFKMRRGDFVAEVKANRGHYDFFVRDMRREGPTIQGLGVDYLHAVTAATQLLNALMRER